MDAQNVQTQGSGPLMDDDVASQKGLRGGDDDSSDTFTLDGGSDKDPPTHGEDEDDTLEWNREQKDDPTDWMKD